MPPSHVDEVDQVPPNDVHTGLRPTSLTAGGTGNRTADLYDTKLDVKVVLSGLWVTMLFVFAYVDIFGFWRADVISGALAGKVPGTGYKISETFLVYTTIYVLIPSLMVLFSLITPAKINRRANLVVSLIYAASVVASALGESWSYYIVGSGVEVLLLLAVARIAWTWPRHPTPHGSTDA